MNSCAAIRNIEEGKIIHDIINNNEKLKNNIILKTTLIDMYSKCGDLNEAEKIFLNSRNPNIITYNCMIKGYLDYDEGKKAFQLYQYMQHQHFKLDEFAYILGLNSCAAIRDIEEGKKLHDIINNDEWILLWWEDDDEKLFSSSDDDAVVVVEWISKLLIEWWKLFLEFWLFELIWS